MKIWACARTWLRDYKHLTGLCSLYWRTPYPQCSLRHLKGVPGLGWIFDRVVIIVRQLLTCHWTDHERDAILSVAKPAEEEYKGKPSNLIGDHLLAGVPEGPVHVSVPVLLVLHPVLLKGLSKVTSLSWFIPRVEWIPEVYHCRFHRQLRIVSCHYIHLINGVVLLVVPREHAILLSSSKPLLLSVGIGGWFPQVVPRSRASHTSFDSHKTSSPN